MVIALRQYPIAVMREILLNLYLLCKTVEGVKPAVGSELELGLVMPEAKDAALRIRHLHAEYLPTERIKIQDLDSIERYFST
mmetsp:Transcript_24810/g.43687  ORF Transcript_24810/g.43687 Transcript_24810/m.43687 type:complete len:82 (+) Transcript_24810:54-299(+)